MPDNYVSYNAQTPSENEKVQARQNIGAMGLNSFDLYMNGAVPRPPVPPFFTQRIPNIVPGYTEFELINGLNHALLIEQTARQNTDLLLKENLEKETADRIQADNQLQENITAEATARENADNQLQQNINAEATARENADTTLQNNINAEKTARENADNQLQQNITAEATARENADNQLRQNITAEATARENADTQLEGKITGLQADLATEKTNRENADTSLQQAITAETTARHGDTETVMGEIDGIKEREYKTVTFTPNGSGFISSLTGKEMLSIYNKGIPLYVITKVDGITYNVGTAVISLYRPNNIDTNLYFAAINPITGDVSFYYIPITESNIVFRAKDTNNNVNLNSLVTTLYTQNFTDSQKNIARNNIGAINEEDVVTNFVSATVIQNFTEEQKARARANIGAGTGGGTSEGAVLYDQAQSLTEEQKAQARTNIGAGTGGSADGAVLYDQEQSLTDSQKLQARKNTQSAGYYVVNKGNIVTNSTPVRLYSGTNENVTKNKTIGGFKLTYSNRNTHELMLQEKSTASWATSFAIPYLNNHNIILCDTLQITITDNPNFTYPLADADLIDGLLGANAGNAVKRFFSGTLNITEAANVVTNCNVLEMYFLPFNTTASAGSSGSLKYKIVLEVTGVSDGSTHQVGNIITLYNKLWDNSYESVSGTVNA